MPQSVAPNPDVDRITSEIAHILRARNQMMAVAESCTGGLVAQWITAHPGSSSWFERGLVTYSNASKAELLGVPWSLIRDSGAVSGPTVLAMASGLLDRSSVDWAISISGIAGPDGGGGRNRVGTVWIGWIGQAATASASRFHFSGDRANVRCSAAAAALSGLLSLLAGPAASDEIHR